MRTAWLIKHLETTLSGCMPQVWKKAVKTAVMQSKYSTCITIIKQTQAKGTSYRGGRISHLLALTTQLGPTDDTSGIYNLTIQLRPLPRSSFSQISISGKPCKRDTKTNGQREKRVYTRRAPFNQIPQEPLDFKLTKESNMRRRRRRSVSNPPYPSPATDKVRPVATSSNPSRAWGKAWG